MGTFLMSVDKFSRFSLTSQKPTDKSGLLFLVQPSGLYSGGVRSSRARTHESESEYEPKALRPPIDAGYRWRARGIGCSERLDGIGFRQIAGGIPFPHQIHSK